ncbi:phosphopantetheinyl transferase [Cordyceps militaris]|uniref:holo-[acyl-carrier-protein] synthase n=1 Tax=Cordyceps militaris TaxID=73501 RepID=A0A2H4SB91_CORMI|nr:phosphopantetheinyl transferase [Cordyceps militaris]
MVTVVQWVLDTRKLWLEASKTAELELVAARAMDLLLDSERAAVLRYYHVRDAKLALGSALLKRLVIAQHIAGVPWAAATPVRDARTKPVFHHPAGSEQQPVLFNVSHQAGLVVLLAAADGAPAGTQLGVDVVCPGERRARDLETVTAADDGWSQYVAMHDSVLSPAEARRLVATEGGPDRRLAHFYALWCLREAYVKMTGEALLASWLGELEMRGFAPPGEGEDELEVFLGPAGGEKVTDVDLRIEWFLGKQYMISTAVRNPDPSVPLPLGTFELLNLETILSKAEELKATR